MAMVMAASNDHAAGAGMRYPLVCPVGFGLAPSWSMGSIEAGLVGGKRVVKRDGIGMRPARAFDAASGRWSYDIATSQLEHVTWEGQRISGTWYFVHEFPGGGTPVRARIKWISTSSGYSEQVSRSQDGGRTWIDTRHINFERAK